jgi:hypothetical protein
MTVRLLATTAVVAIAVPCATPAEPPAPQGPPPQVTVIWPRPDVGPVIQYVRERRLTPAEWKREFTVPVLPGGGPGTEDRVAARWPGPEALAKLAGPDGRVPVQDVVVAPVDGKAVRAFGVDGKAVDPKDVRARVTGPTVALLSTDGKAVDPFYLRLAKEGTLVLVGPVAVGTTAALAASPPIVLPPEDRQPGPLWRP